MSRLGSVPCSSEDAREEEARLRARAKKKSVVSARSSARTCKRAAPPRADLPSCKQAALEVVGVDEVDEVVRGRSPRERATQSACVSSRATSAGRGTARAGGDGRVEAAVVQRLELGEADARTRSPPRSRLPAARSSSDPTTYRPPSSEAGLSERLPGTYVHLASPLDVAAHSQKPAERVRRAGLEEGVVPQRLLKRHEAFDAFLHRGRPVHVRRADPPRQILGAAGHATSRGVEQPPLTGRDRILRATQVPALAGHRPPVQGEAFAGPRPLRRRSRASSRRAVRSSGAERSDGQHVEDVLRRWSLSH